MGPRCSFWGTSTGPFAEVAGLFTVLMCASCQAARHEAPAEMLAHHDPGGPWLKWGCPIEGCGHRVIGPWELEGHTEAEHPGWVATYKRLRPYPNQRTRVVYRRSTAPTSERSTPGQPSASPPSTQHGHDPGGGRSSNP